MEAGFSALCPTHRLEYNSRAVCDAHCQCHRQLFVPEGAYNNKLVLPWRSCIEGEIVLGVGLAPRDQRDQGACVIDRKWTRVRQGPVVLRLGPWVVDDAVEESLASSVTLRDSWLYQGAFVHCIRLGMGRERYSDVYLRLRRAMANSARRASVLLSRTGPTVPHLRQRDT